jgi:hypothetical protein
VAELNTPDGKVHATVVTIDPETGEAIVPSDVVLVGPASLSALNADLLTGTVNGWYDARSFQSASVQVIASAGITAGAFIFEQTNDPVLAPAGVPLRAYESALINSNPIVAAVTIAANTNRIWTVPLNARYFRVRISTAFTGGTVSVSAVLSERPASYPVVNVQQAVASNLLTTATSTGPVAHDAAISGNPNRISGRALTANYAAVQTGDTADLITTLVGALVTKPFAIPEQTWNANVSLTTTTAVALSAAAGAGLKRHITGLQAINTGASTVDLILLDGATERWRLPLPVNVPVSVVFNTELLTTANAALNANLSATGTVRINAQGYTAP